MKLPLLLAGPIVRRVDSTRALFWLATSRKVESASVVLRYCRVDGSLGAVDPTTTSAQAVRLGNQLWVHLLTVRPRGRKLHQNELAYDIALRIGGRTHALADLVDIDSIRYPPKAAPTLPALQRSSRLLYSSCRNPNGGGEESLISADEWTARAMSVPGSSHRKEHRPESLFLTGDQIYADDLEDELLHLVTRLAGGLAGYTEQVPGYATKWLQYSERDLRDYRGPVNWPVDAPTSRERVRYVVQLRPEELMEPRYLREVTNPQNYEPARLPLRRGQFVRTHAGFTTGDENHLLTFGEYAAMYLLAWNPDLWPTSGLTEKMKQYRRGTPAIRRLMANTPTYMFYDDHEVTDDWNIDALWEKRVRSSVTGRRIVAYALAAFWAFQAWGNQPDNFSPDFVRGIEDYLAHERATRGQPDEARALAFENQMWDFHRWGFWAPTTPPAVFLDTRTQRDSNPATPAYGNQRLKAPRLMNDQALKEMVRNARAAGHRPGAPVILVSPTPVFGYRAAELAQERLLVEGLVPKKPGGRYKWDLESWAACPLGLFRFLSSVAENLRPSYVVVLSGDVHYGFTTTAVYGQLRDYWRTGGAAAAGHIAFLQLTSSGSRNSSEETRDVLGSKLPIASLAAQATARYLRGRVGLPRGSVVRFALPGRPKEQAAYYTRKEHVHTGERDHVVGETNVGMVVFHDLGRARDAVEHVLLKRTDDGQDEFHRILLTTLPGRH